MIKTAASIFKIVRSANLLTPTVRYASQALPEFTEVKYNVKRKDFATVQAADVDFFRSVLSAERVLTEESDVLPYNIDWIKNCRGQSRVVLRPRSSKEVSRLLQHCSARGLAVCPQGGNTGLVGGSVPVFDEVVISLALMNNIISFDEVSGGLVCEAGCVLEALERHVHERGHIMPLDLGAKGTCHIGGNVSTNAGGQRLLRYGNLHGSLLGIEAVRADGTVVDCLHTLKKDNTGYHLKHLFVGSEGTLGVVTKVALHCPVLPAAINLGFFGLSSFEAVLGLYRRARAALGEILSAFEMADAAAIDASVHGLHIPNPISEHPFYVLIETHGSDETHDGEKLSRFLEREMESGTIADGTVTADPGKVQNIWSLRENISNAVMLDGYVYKYDVSLPLPHFYELVPALRQRLGAAATRVCGYGHIGDGNIHINVTAPAYSAGLLAQLEPHVFECVARLRGSVSAEHGVGFRKPHALHYSKGPAALQLMRDLKAMMDPRGILNPYKVLPDH